MKSTRKVVLLASAAAVTAALLLLAHRPVHESPPAPVSNRPATSDIAHTGAAAVSKTTLAPPGADSGALIDICGLGKVHVAEAEDAAAALDAKMKRDKVQWLASLRASSDPRAHAASMLLAGAGKGDALAQLAVQSADPVLYDFALGACAREDTSGAACSQISPETWAQLDPENAVPWLQAAQRARLAGDSAAEAAAMRQAAGAQRVEDYHLSLYAYAQAGMPPDWGALERHALGLQAIGIAASTGMQYAEASKYCSRQALGEGRVADECRALAELFESQGRTLIDLAVAKSIGARVGWSMQRVEDAANDFEALQAVLPEAVPGADDLSCGALSASNAYFLEMARSGEIEALRERLERSGVSIPELAQQHRDFIGKLQRAAIAEAEAAEKSQELNVAARAGDMP